MGLQRLVLQDFRCFASAELEFSPGTNLIFGDNASGKTSLLEAIFFLGRARSFRTPRSEHLVRNGAAGFLISGHTSGPGGNIAAGIARGVQGLEARIGGAPAQNLAQLSELLPVQLLDAGSHQLIEGGPRHRRQFLDWGVFHVEPGFMPVWRRYQRALKQRNTLLRQGAEEGLIKTWEPELAVAGERLDQYRRDYLGNFEATALSWTRQVLGGLELRFRYRSGWLEGQPLAEALSVGRSRDREQGGTKTGPHRAEVVLEIDGSLAQQRVSRGQQKVLAGTLLLAQTAYLRQATGRQALLLLDDLAAELDAAHLSRFLELVRDTGAQVFLSTVERDQIAPAGEVRLFHVKQGVVRQMV
jgi:DNA replication and repair protein RecF